LISKNLNNSCLIHKFLCLSLKRLNLAANQISRIEASAFATNTQLHWLNLSENRINDIRDISELRVLPALAHLYLADPDYAPNPLALLPGCDYFVLFFLPKLLSLNGAPVPASIIQETIPAFINRRRLFLLYRALTEARVQHETVTSACINRPSVSQSVRDALRLVAKAVRLGIADVSLILFNYLGPFHSSSSHRLMSLYVLCGRSERLSENRSSHCLCPQPKSAAS
jgi:hypothetical protein